MGTGAFLARDLPWATHGCDYVFAGPCGQISTYAVERFLGDLAVELTENLVHGSDGPESAAREIALFFPGLS